jgi:hypothetical protein
MASRKKQTVTQGLTSKSGIEGIVFREDVETSRKKTSASQKAQIKQQSELEKAFSRQDTAIKDALKLF